MNSNEQLIDDFYTAFKNLDWQAMARCYHQDIQFSDPVFTDLKGEDATTMWQMLCTKAQDFDLQYSDIKADDSHGAARWEASYTFSQTGNRVHNIIYAEFQFADGKIIRHSDHFNLWRWCTQALGLPGRLLGWSGFFRRKVQQKALSGLAMFKRRLKSKAGQ